MSQAQDTRYAFRDLPIEPVPEGTNLLVTGPSLGGLRELLMQLLTGPPEEGILLVTADVSASEAVADFQAIGGDADSPRLCLIDCAQESDATESDRVHGVGTPADLTGIGMSFSALYEQLYASGTARVRTGLYTLGPLLVYADDVRPVYRFIHTMTGRIRMAEGLGVCGVDPAALDDRTVTSVRQAFDGQIELAASEGHHEIRIRGLDGQREGWQPIEL